eukprot:2922776-Amphidinium_carterae.1
MRCILLKKAHWLEGLVTTAQRFVLLIAGWGVDTLWGFIPPCEMLKRHSGGAANVRCPVASFFFVCRSGLVERTWCDCWLVLLSRCSASGCHPAL